MLGDDDGDIVVAPVGVAAHRREHRSTVPHTDPFVVARTWASRSMLVSIGSSRRSTSPSV